MQISFYNVYDQCDDKERTTATKIGCVAMLMSMSRVHRGYPMSYLLKTVYPALAEDNIKFFFNEDGKAVGYVMWALLSRATEERLLASRRFGLHPSEWNEGDSAWIIDFAAMPGYAKYILRNLKATVFGSQVRVHYWRPTPSRPAIKCFNATKPHGFFMVGTQAPALCRCGSEDCVRHAKNLPPFS
jgi:hemolysin-activating ACP:hemolysin acyltransferase